MRAAACTEALTQGGFSVYFAPSRLTDRPVATLPKFVLPARPLLILPAILAAVAVSGCKSRGEETGRQHGNNVEILSGLEAGETIITGSEDQSEDAQPVTP